MIIPFPVKTTIEERRSVRSYKMMDIEDEILKELKNFIISVKLPFEHKVEVRFFNAEPTRALYPLIKSPPQNVAFMSETDVLSISKAGFIGELVILFAQSKGLSTCWYGHYRLSELQRLMPHLEKNERVGESIKKYGYSKGATEERRAICLTPLGYHENAGFRLMDRITEKTFSFRRKEIKKLLEIPEDMEKVPEDILYSLDLGRKAPSAANSQMWRFCFDDDYRTIKISMPIGYRHFKWEHPDVDIGICACHVWLGLVDKGHEPVFSVSQVSGRTVWRISV